jgi:Ca2+-binding EF-hand superfamily protein
MMKGSKFKAPPPPPRQVLNPRERLSEQDIEDLKATFELFDEDHTNTIDPQEIQKILEELGLDKRNQVVFMMMNDLKAKNRPINFEEFLDIICNRLGDTKSREGLNKLFALYDVNDEGFINFEKIKNIAKELGETMNDDEISEMMHNTHILNHTQSNEYFDFDEFYDIVTKKKY